MAKVYTTVGFAKSEKSDGVVTNSITEKSYSAEVMKNNLRNERSGNVIDNLNVSVRLSILADPFALKNFRTMVYATYYGAKWKITDIEISYPRLILSIGGLYNE